MMKNPSLERFYLQIDKSILLAQSYTEIDYLYFMIKSCRLKPYDLFFNGDKYELKLFRWWFDEFGNSFKIVKNKRLKIIYNDLSLDNKKIICTDLYYGISLDKIIKISKVLHLLIGIDEDTHDNYCSLTFLGLDDYLRSYVFLRGEWVKVSPLNLGIKKLKNIINHKDIKYFLEVFNKENCISPCRSTNEWLTSLPLKKEFLAAVKNRHDVDFSFLQPEEMII